MTVQIHGRAKASSASLFAYPLKAVPNTPTECLKCKTPLEPLRRYAGLCKACVAARKKHAARPPPAMHVLRQFVRKGVTYVRLKCGCGRRRTMRLGDYNAQHPQCCNRCRLRAVERQGFEAEFVR